MVTSSWTLLSILTAVVSENMISTTGQQEEEMRISQDVEDRAEYLADVKELFEGIHKTQDGIVRFDCLTEFMEDKEHANMTAKRCGLPARNVLGLLETLSSTGEPVEMDMFINALADAGKPVTEQSIQKIEKLFEKFLHEFKAHRELISKKSG